MIFSPLTPIIRGKRFWCSMSKYEVPGMKLIPQQRTMSCWYASAQMIIHWQMNRCQQSFADLIPPELDAECRKLRDDNGGIKNPQIPAMARRLGLREEPPATPSLDFLETLLRVHGPLWVNGDVHIVVLAGIDGELVKVYDPWPPNTGSVEWRSLSGWLFREVPIEYVVKRGDNLSTIGRLHGMDWQDLYKHPKNAEFRRKRPNPDLIHPGDVIHIPTSASDMDTTGPVTFLYLPTRACAIL